MRLSTKAEEDFPSETFDAILSLSSLVCPHRYDLCKSKCSVKLYNKLFSRLFHRQITKGARPHKTYGLALFYPIRLSEITS